MNRHVYSAPWKLGRVKGGAKMNVHIVDAAGRPLYDRLVDDGSLVLVFAGGFGFVDRLDVERFGWRVVAGWRVAS